MLQDSVVLWLRNYGYTLWANLTTLEGGQYDALSWMFSDDLDMKIYMNGVFVFLRLHSLKASPDGLKIGLGSRRCNQVLRIKVKVGVSSRFWDLFTLAHDGKQTNSWKSTYNLVIDFSFNLYNSAVINMFCNWVSVQTSTVILSSTWMYGDRNAQILKYLTIEFYGFGIVRHTKHTALNMYYTRLQFENWRLFGTGINCVGNTWSEGVVVVFRSVIYLIQLLVGSA